MFDAPTQPVNRITNQNPSAAPERERGGQSEIRNPQCTPRWQKIMSVGDTSPHARIAGLRQLARAAENMLKHELRRRATLGVDETYFCWDPVRQICHTLEIAPHKLSALLKEFNGLAAHELADLVRAKKIKAKLRADLRDWVLKTRGQPGEREHSERRDNNFALLWSRLKKSRSQNPFYECDLDRPYSDVLMRPRPLPLPLGEGRREHHRLRHRRRTRGEGVVAPLAERPSSSSANPQSEIRNPQFPRRSLLTADAEFPRRTWSNPRKNLHLEAQENLFDKTQWAINHGFTNHARFHKACLLEHRKTPRQIEYDLLREICDYYASAESLRRRNVALKHGADDGGPNSLLAAEIFGEDIDPRPSKPYEDRWSFDKFARYEWLKKMYEDFGLSGALTDDEDHVQPATAPTSNQEQ